MKRPTASECPERRGRQFDWRIRLRSQVLTHFCGWHWLWRLPWRRGSCGAPGGWRRCGLFWRLGRANLRFVRRAQLAGDFGVGEALGEEVFDLVALGVGRVGLLGLGVGAGSLAARLRKGGIWTSWPKRRPPEIRLTTAPMRLRDSALDKYLTSRYHPTMGTSNSSSSRPRAPKLKKVRRLRPKRVRKGNETGPESTEKAPKRY